MSRSLSLVGLMVVAGLAFACQPDVHIHIYYETDGPAGDDDGDDGATQGQGDGTGNADGNPNPATTMPPGDDGDPPMTSGPPPGTADDDSGGSGGGVDMYPQPEGGVCPDGLAYSQIVAGFEFCAPACMGGMCPQPISGTAPGQCVFNPQSSNTACEPDGEPCPPGEGCSPSQGCTLPATHCAAVCTSGQTCPDGMMCSPIGACQYPA